MSIVKEFREFIARGNVIDLAVGVIIGAAFNGIVKSLVDQVIMPPIGLLTGGLDFSKLEWVLRAEDPATEAIEKVAIQYGAFINTLIQFFIVAAVVFLLVKLVNQIRRADAAEPAPEAPAAPTPEEKLLTEIRDLLAKPAVAAVVPAAEKPAPVAKAAAAPKAPAKKPAAPRKPKG
ncbi:large-conductance mechanosensitive channel protein MscL [Caulobacter sp. CCNWLY153]|jgi:large conductance mechanosensitive channel|uniref:large-conductance mechanosensitive channel protein MscL n=1 Tax=Caulobacter sp. CCNWYY153 TaxID=3125797 RepID=UPI001FAE9DBC|nr:large-conductance mechanosensitive channel protein MscL [Caulobacter radicis]